MNRYRLAALLVFVVFALPLLAADNLVDELEHNARLLAKWKADPEHYARLQREQHQFAALLPERQEKLRQFDRELHNCDSQTQQRLWETLERYAAWLDQLPEADRQQLLAIPNKQERLEAIKAKCRQQWLERLPAKERDYLGEHSEETERRYHDDIQRRQQWLNALSLRPDLRPRPHKPGTLEEFPPEVIAFVNDTLMPMLPEQEKTQLKATHGWPALAQLLLDLSDKHPVLPPFNNKPIVSFRDLPTVDSKALGKSSRFSPLREHEGRWPEFALAVADWAARTNHPLPRGLGACKPGEFSTDIQEFIKERLLPALTPEEAQRLGRTEGQWPAYPKLLRELAKKYNLVIPGMSLPGTSEFWESARIAALPEVPDHELRAFVCELSHEDLRRLNLSPLDPMSRDRLRQEYFRRNPGFLLRQHELDQHKKK
jgi:hypothetical protein